MMTSNEEDTMTASTPAFSRKRVNLQSDLSLPADLVTQLRETSQRIAGLYKKQHTPLASNVTNQLEVIQSAVTSMIETATTPELFLRSVSNITSALRLLKTASSLPEADAVKATYDALAALLSQQLVLPFLMDCRARFAHRALFSLLRSNYDLSSSPELVQDAKVLFSKVFLQNALFLKDKSGAPRLYILEESCSASLSDKQDGKGRVLHFLNSLDCLSSTIMTQLPDVFQEFFVSLLPLLADAMQWAVEEALVTGSRLSAHVQLPSANNSSAPSAATSTSTTAVTIGEDLDNIRFTVRVVTSFVHKHLTALDRAWNSAAERDVLRHVTRLALPMFVMLASSEFPKDVLNATGLLFASILTLRRRAASDIQYFVSLLCAPEGAAAVPFRVASMRDAGRFSSDVEAFVEMTCGKEEGPRFPLGGHGLMESLFAKVTLNGRFAICKGLLSHLSSPAHQTADCVHAAIASVGVLMASHARGDAQPTSTLYKDIVPFAFHCSSSAEDSETRFMAIQTLDAVVRHVGAVLRFVYKTGRKAQAGGAAITAVPAFALPSEALFRTLQSVSQIVTDLWDDSTTQMSGTLTDTFDEVLKVNELLRQCMAWAVETKQQTPPLEELNAFVMDGASMLKHVLCMSPERRGRYHALLALLSAVPLPTFLSVLGQVATEKSHLSGASAPCESDDEKHVVAFACTLLSGASNHKIGNVCGDTFTRLARCLQEQGQQRDGKDKKNRSGAAAHVTLLEKGLIDPLCRMLTQENKLLCATASVTPATNLSNMVAHFVSPLIKYKESLLQVITRTILTLVAAEKERGVYATQAMVEILVRSRNAGVDIQSYLQDPRVFQMVQFALQAAQCEVRSMAVALAVLGTKKFVPITDQECTAVETYLSLNMHLGGDTTAQKQLTELFRKWTKRVVDSYTESKRAAPRGGGAGGDAQTNAASALPLGTHQITEHAVRLGTLFAEHMGCNAAAAGVVGKLSVERRVMASRLYLLFLRAWLPVVVGDEDAGRRVLISSVVPVLFSDLSDGWSFARDGAKSLLRIFISLCPEHVYPNTNEDAVAEIMATAERDALRAHAHRNAVGSAARMCLAVLFLSRQRGEDADTFVRHLMDCIDGHKLKVASDCIHIIAATTITEKYTFMQANPLHGRLALCTELLAQLFDVRSEERERGAPCTVDIQDCLNGIFVCCSQVLEACSSLVGSETSSSADETVDCRGHVYDKDASHSEADMRGVVNNTWLGIRVATGTIPLILSHCSITSFHEDVVRQLCFNLVHALLMTKHNGVMRCTREALNVLTRNLMRCRTPELFRIPTELLSFLLGVEGVASTDVSRMLRRSQGLPHAILAVLEAEDPTTPFVLFPLAMKTLLSIAAPREQGGEAPLPSGSAAELSQQSNALNVLKFIFENKFFADCLSPYVESAFSLATCGMSHASWSIRNSSLMLFSSVLQRLVGEHPSTGGVGVNTSLLDVARRTPRVMQFIVAELCRHEEALVVAAATGHREMKTLALFPVLQLLSMLSPDVSNVSVASSARGDEGEAVSRALHEAASVTENVWRCHASPQLMIRTSSATALTCIVPTHDVVALLQRAVPVMAVKHEGDRDYFNKVHGVLVQLGQFHRKYVGTVRRRQREHVYSASTAVKQSIQTTIMSVMVECERKLRWCCERCPTIAVAVLSLFNDLLHCLPSVLHRAAESNLFPSLCLLGAQVIRSAVCAPAPPVVEKGELMQGSALGVVLLLSKAIQSEPLPSAVKTELQTVMQHVAHQALTLRDGQHHFVTRVLESLCTGEEGAATSACHDSSLIVDAFLTHFQYDLPSISLAAVRSTLSELSGASAAQEKGEAELGCVSWYELSIHLQFLVRHFSQHEGSVQQVQHQLELVSLLEKDLLREVENNNSNPNADDGVGYLTNAEVLRGALCFYALRTTLLHPTGGAPVAPACILSCFARPQHVPLIRDAVVDGLKVIVANSVRLKTSVPSALLLVLLRLLCDDAAQVREHACVVATDCINYHCGTDRGCLDQVSCILGLVLMLRHAKTTEKQMESNLNQFLTSDREGDGAVEEGEENEDETEVLFEKEADNMFIEDALVLFMRQEIEYDGTSLPPHSSVFPSYAKLIAAAEASRTVDFFSTHIGQTRCT